MESTFIRIKNEFVGGMIEMVVAVMFAVTVNGFTAFKYPGLNWDPLLISVAIFFLFSIFINFIKGWLLPLDAMFNILGMIAMLILAKGVFWSIAPDAVIECFAYIIAAVVGIYLGARFRFRDARQSQEQYYDWYR